MITVDEALDKDMALSDEEYFRVHGTLNVARIEGLLRMTVCVEGSEWALPEFKFNESGFLIIGEHEAPYTCKYCGMPSWIDPSDQSPPPDYCHEIDHGTSKDRASYN